MAEPEFAANVSRVMVVDEGLTPSHMPWVTVIGDPYDAEVSPAAVAVTVRSDPDTFAPGTAERPEPVEVYRATLTNPPATPAPRRISHPLTDPAPCSRK